MLVLHNNNYTISNSNRIKLYLTQVDILKLNQIILDQLLNLNTFSAAAATIYLKHYSSFPTPDIHICHVKEAKRKESS